MHALVQLAVFASCVVVTTLLYWRYPGHNRIERECIRIAQSRAWVAPVLAAAAYIVTFYAFEMPAVPLLAPDSIDYLNGSPTVPLGYRTFAYLVSFTTGDLAALPAFQISIWAACVIALYVALAKTLQFRAIAATVCVVVLTLGTTTKYAMFALTESVFVSTLVLHIAGVLLVFDKPTRSRLLWVGATAFLAGFLRPAGYFVPICTFALLVLLPTYRRKVLQFAVAPMLLLYVGAGTVGHLHRGEATQSLLGFALFPYVASLFQANYVSPELRPAAVDVENALADYRAEWSTKRDRAGRIDFEIENFNRVSRQAEGVLGDRGIPSTQTNDYFATFAFATLRNRPLDYLALVAEHAVFAWRWLFYPNNVTVWLKENYRLWEPDHNRFVDLVSAMKVPKYRYVELESGERTLDRSSALQDYVPIKLGTVPGIGETFGAIALLSIFAGLLFGERCEDLRPAAYIALLMHGAVLLTTSTTIVIMRYVDPISPLAIVLVALIADCLRALPRKYVSTASA